MVEVIPVIPYHAAPPFWLMIQDCAAGVAAHDIVVIPPVVKLPPTTVKEPDLLVFV